MSTQLLAEWMREASRILIFTGAGISTSSGIPDFRGPTGLWKEWKPVYYQEFVSSHEARIRHWEFKLSGWEAFKHAQPNAAHLSIVKLEGQRKLFCLVTQNIDGLHQMAGTSDELVIELHGTNRRVECIDCGTGYDPDPVFREFGKTRQPPCCSRCEGFLKPATISFGQQMPVDKLERAFAAARECDFVLSIGSTLEVEPAASVPRLAAESCSRYAIINQGRTAHDSLADLRIEGDASVVLPQAVEKLAGPAR